MQTQQELDAMAEALRAQGLTWSQTNFAVSLVRNAVTAESEKWRELAQRMAHQGNARGLEGLKVRCTISEAGSVVSWEVDRAGPLRCDGCGKTIAEHDRLLRCCGPNVRVKPDAVGDSA